MNDIDELTERISDAKNRVFETKESPAIGARIPSAMPTNEAHVYRSTGKNQLTDILASGYVRPKAVKVKGGHTNEVFWSRGSNKLFYYFDQAIILEALASKVHDGQIGAIPFSDLTAIWIYNKEAGRFENKIAFYREVYSNVHDNNETTHKNK